MQPAKKNVAKVLSAISMAAAATLAAKSAQAQLVSPFYGQAQSGAAQASTDGVFLENSSKNFATATFETISNTSPTTITVPLGDYLFMAMDAVITGNVNPDGGKFTGNTGGDPGATQPSNLGLSGIGIQILSSDTHGANLQPVLGAQITGNPSYAQGFGYASKAQLNTTTGNHTTGAYVPSWTGTSSNGDVEPTFGSVALNDAIGGGNTPSSHTGTAAIANQLGMFGGTAATDAQATTVFTNLFFQRTGTGAVTLTPQVIPGDSGYWHLTSSGDASTPSVYSVIPLTASNVAQLPVLVIAGPASAQPVISLTTNTPSTYGANQGPLAVIPEPGNTHYQPGEIQFGPINKGYVTVTGFTPVTDNEVYALDVLVNGTEATPSQIATLIAAINGDGQAPASGVLAASGTWAGGAFGTGPFTGANPFPAVVTSSPFNLYLDMAGTAMPEYFGFDVSNQDTLLQGYTVEAIAVVPEPMSLGLLMLGGMGLMARRNRRKA